VRGGVERRYLLVAGLDELDSRDRVEAAEDAVDAVAGLGENAFRPAPGGGMPWRDRNSRPEAEMAELTTLEEKLAEVLGLAQAAQGVTEKVEGLVDDEEIAQKLQKQRQEAAETERRCIDIAERRDGKKTAVLEKAAETKSEATEMMRTYLGDDADGLDGFEFLIMAEAGEVGHWGVLGKLNESAGEEGVAELVEWAKPIQERHFEEARECSLTLAAEEDPYEES
jgi:hypothetical protein